MNDFCFFWPASIGFQIARKQFETSYAGAVVHTCKNYENT